MHDLSRSPTASIAQAAARLAVEEGLEYAAAKQRAIRQLKLPARTALPSNKEVDAAVREYITIFCADTQPLELAALRELAVQWMQRLAEFAPLLGGAVWHGTATRLSDIYLQLFSDDPKAVEIALLNARIAYQASQTRGLHGAQVDVLSCHAWCSGLSEDVGMHLFVNPMQAQRGASLPDADGQRPRGTLVQLQQRMTETGETV